jgi:hypothetical protein
LASLEDRLTPASGWFFEDFTNDYDSGRGGFDHIRDGVQISAQRVGARFVPTPAGGPAGRHTLSLAAGNRPEASYLGWTYHTNESGGLAPWEMVVGASVKVRGGGTVRFAGVDEITFTNTAPADQWVTFSVTKDTVGDRGSPLGEVIWIQVATTGQMVVDDVGVQIGSGPLTGEGGEVNVHRFGNGLSVTGSAKSDLVRVEFLYDAAGTIRVIGLAGTRVTSRTLDVIQVSEDVVEVPGFAHVQIFDDGEPTLPERDLFVHLAGGDDWLEVAGTDLGGVDPATRIDDLIISSGFRDSIVSLQRVQLWDTLAISGGPGQDAVAIDGQTVIANVKVRTEAGNDTIAISGQTLIAGIDVRTGAGDDTIQIGQPGVKVFDGDLPLGVLIVGRTEGTNRSTDGVYTGPGRDTLLMAGTFHGLTIDLGDGPDRLRMESADGIGLWVVPGAGNDLVEFIEIDLDYVKLVQDSFDLFRLHRVEVLEVFFSPQRSGVRFQLPATGTHLRYQNFLYPLNPSDALSEVASTVFSLVGVTSMGLANRSFVEFAPTDF